MLAARSFRWLLWSSSAALALAGAAWLGHAELQRQNNTFDTDARIAHRLLSQRVVQHDAVLATLALLQPDEADRPEQRLPAVYPQILQVRRRMPNGIWNDAALAAAEPISRAQRHASVASLDASAGHYDLVMAAGDGAYALGIDIRQTVPWDEWPLPPDRSEARVALELSGHAPYILQPGKADSRPGWSLAFEKVLASPSQPFNLVITRHLGWSALPWWSMAGWVALVLLGAATWTAWQRQATERRRAEELLRLGQVARLNTLGELAAGLAHELNQPLTAVVANTQAASRLLREQPSADATAVSAMEQAVAQARRAAEVVGRLRRVVEQPATANALQAVVLQDAVHNALHLLQPECRRRQVSPTVENTVADLRVSADPIALEQIVHNLLMNALQALEHVPPERRHLVLHLSASERHGRLDIQDSGPGIPPEAMAQLFQPFFSTREGGLGLGLSLCETLATNMGGTLTARNLDGAGAAFTLTLPRTTP
jgi:signal transduction histidine kinase